MINAATTASSASATGATAQPVEQGAALDGGLFAMLLAGLGAVPTPMPGAPQANSATPTTNSDGGAITINERGLPDLALLPAAGAGLTSTGLPAEGAPEAGFDPLLPAPDAGNGDAALPTLGSQPAAVPTPSAAAPWLATPATLPWSPVLIAPEPATAPAALAANSGEAAALATPPQVDAEAQMLPQSGPIEQASATVAAEMAGPLAAALAGSDDAGAAEPDLPQPAGSSPAGSAAASTAALANAANAAASAATSQVAAVPGTREAMASQHAKADAAAKSAVAAPERTAESAAGADDDTPAPATEAGGHNGNDALGLAPADAGSRAERPQAPARAAAAYAPPPVQIVMQMADAAARGAERVSIQLHPAELGQVEVHLEFDQDGAMHASIIADRPETLDLLQRDMRGLERSLSDAGVRLDSSGLSFSLKQDSNPQPQQQQQQQQPQQQAGGGQNEQRGRPHNPALMMLEQFAAPAARQSAALSLRLVDIQA